MVGFSSLDTCEANLDGNLVKGREKSARCSARIQTSQEAHTHIHPTTGLGGRVHGVDGHSEAHSHMAGQKLVQPRQEVLLPGQGLVWWAFTSLPEAHGAGMAHAIFPTTFQKVKF